jgi:hypothetical protein
MRPGRYQGTCEPNERRKLNLESPESPLVAYSKLYSAVPETFTTLVSGEKAGGKSVSLFPGEKRKQQSSLENCWRLF